MAMENNFTWGSVALRFLTAALLVYLTYNPEGFSFYHWAIMPLREVPATSFSAINPLKVLAGIALLVGWVVFIQATKRSLGFKGALLTIALFGGIIWVLIYWNVFTPRGTRAISHLILIILALVLAVGMSWSHLTRRLSGQVDTDQIA